MSAPEVVEGAFSEVPDERALVVRQQPGQALVTNTDHMSGAQDMVVVAASLAAALKDIVERQRLYALIQGRKYPQVEAWMTIARMDNVVAREVADGIVRHDDGSYEASVELIRLSDGMVIGRGSALCGTAGDKPWDGRAEPARRSMAVTRATSRAFRQQYSWIMALAGYEPTPAEEMPRDERPAADRTEADGSLIGTAEATDKQSTDFMLRQGPDGPTLGFRLKGDGGAVQVRCSGALAVQVEKCREAVVGRIVTCWGQVSEESFTPKSGGRAVTYRVLAATRVRVPGVGDLPSGDAPAPLPRTEQEELDALVW